MTNTNLSASVSGHFSCLLVDDDEEFAGLLAKVVSQEGGTPVVCRSVGEAAEQIRRQTFDVAILDNRLPDGNGYDFYARLMHRQRASVVAMITGVPELSQAIELTRNGLFDYLTKPVSTVEFTALLHRVRRRLGRPDLDTGGQRLLGEAPAMREVMAQLQLAARHEGATVLLVGETGTGKELAARHLHELTYRERSPRAPYLALNAPSVPAEMFEAELFGSEKGAYTGADRRRSGLVEAAEGGTLFLDEVAEIPLALQPKLLRFLESREYRVLGATATNTFHGRVVAATNRSLAQEVRAGRFREDLMYRLDVFTIRLPPLREHLADVDCIAEALLQQLCEKYERAVPLIKREDLDGLRGHPFPGNVRELRNVLERSLLRTEAGAKYLSIDLAWLGVQGPGAPPPEALPVPTGIPVKRHLTPIERQEYQLIAIALRLEDGGIRRAATRLGLTHQALLRRLEKWPELRQVAPPSG